MNFIERIGVILPAMFVVTMLMLMSGIAQATERNLTVDTLVDEDDGDMSLGDVSLREAIFFVSPGGTVNFSSDLSGGTITLTLGQLEITKDLSIKGLGADRIAVSGNKTFRVFRVDDGDNTNASTVAIDGLTIREGRAVGGNFSGDGAGVFNAENLTLTNSVISRSESSNVSGGVFNTGNGNIVVRDCQIVDNIGPFGAGFRNYGTGEIINSTISGNSATEFGGGIDNFGGSLEIINTTITGNSAGRGGGIGVGGSGFGQVVIVGSTVSDNAANLGAGILANDPVEITDSLITDNEGEGITVQSTLSITNSTVSYNTRGIVNNSATVRIKKTTIITPNNGQSLQNFGGTMELIDSTTTGLGTGHPGLDVFGGTVTVTNSTISNHGVAGGGGGISGAGGRVKLQNTILALNEAFSGPDCDREVISLGNNIIGDPSGCDISLQPTDLTGDPGLGPFTDDGTPGNGHFPLLATSQAIDAGDNVACAPTDQLGNPRIDGNGDGNVVCDIGAIEGVGSANVNDLVTFDPDPSTYYTTRNTSSCPSSFVGKFSFEAQLANISQSALSNLAVQVAELTRGNLVLTADGTTIGEGDAFPVPEEDDYSDGLLAPSEYVDVPFTICLKNRKSFRFFVDVLGAVEPSVPTFLFEWGSSGTSLGEFALPQGIVVDCRGDVYVADSNNNRLQKFDAVGDVIAAWSTASNPFLLGIDSCSNIYSGAEGENLVQRFQRDGTFVTAWELSVPKGISVGPKSGAVYIANWSPAVYKFTPDGALLTTFGSSSLTCPEGVAVDAYENVYVADSCRDSVQKFESDGTLIRSWGSSGDSPGQFRGPHGVAVDEAGNVFVVDLGNARVQKFTGEGQFILQWGSPGGNEGEFAAPRDLAFGVDGSIYVTDSGNDRIQVFSQ